MLMLRLLAGMVRISAWVLIAACAAATYFPGFIFHLFSPAVHAVNAGPEGVFHGLYWSIFKSAEILYLPFFLAGLLAVIWMLESEFLVYEHRKMIMLWLCLPLPFVFISRSPQEALFPALAAFAPAVGIMSPSFTRKFLIFAMLFFALSFQTGFSGEIFGKRELGVEAFFMGFGLDPKMDEIDVIEF